MVLGNSDQVIVVECGGHTLRDSSNVLHVKIGFAAIVRVGFAFSRALVASLILDVHQAVVIGLGERSEV